MKMTMHKQAGAAAIYLVFLMVPLFGTVFLALEGTRYIQKQNRLADASEAAVLAITMANRGNTTHYEQTLSTKYVQSYVRNIKTPPVLSVSVKEGEDIIGKVRKPYFQYKVDATTAHKSWFSSLLIPSFSSVESIVNKAIARNYPEIAGDKYVDIVFVSDFSASMNYIWEGRTKRIDALKDAVLKISTEILDESDDKGKNRIGFVPFNMRVQRYVEGEKLCVTQLSYKDNVGGYGYTPYEQINWKKYVTELPTQNIRNCAYYGNGCGNLPRNDARTIMNISGSNKNIHPDPYKYVDIGKTVKNVFIDKIDNVKLHPKANYYNYNHLWSKYSCNTNFHSIAMTENINDLQVIKSMTAFGGTSVYQGMIQGAQILQKEKNKYTTDTEKADYKKRLKMLFILSDGVEDPYKETFKKLVNYGGTGKGLCQKIKNEFSDSDVPLYMTVLGINFDASKQLVFKQCVGENNIVDVRNVDDLIIKIKEMIKKGAQTEGISKLHYRNLN